MSPTLTPSFTQTRVFTDTDTVLAELHPNGPVAAAARTEIISALTHATLDDLEANFDVALTLATKLDQGSRIEVFRAASRAEDADERRSFWARVAVASARRAR